MCETDPDSVVAVVVDIMIIMLGLSYDVMSCFRTLDISSGQPSK